MFQDEIAAFQNGFGVYLIGEDGAILDPKIIFPRVEHAEAIPQFPFARPGGGPLEPGEGVLLSELYGADQLQPGVQFGLFLIASEFRMDPDELSGLSFVNAAGEPATIFDEGVRLVGADGSVIPLDVFHTVDPTPGTPLENPLNPGGGLQAISAVLPQGLFVGFEDKRPGIGDADFNDLLVELRPTDPAGTSLEFVGLTPDLTEVLGTIVSDPAAVEQVPQVGPQAGDLAIAGTSSSEAATIVPVDETTANPAFVG